jgi:hypothetical protein
MSRPMRRALHVDIAMLLAMTALVSACGQSSRDASDTHAKHAGKAVTSEPPKPASGIDPDMVNAVSAAGASTTPISMKFKLGGRPLVMTPLQLTLLVIPSSDVTVNHIHVSFQPSDGLQLQSERALDLTDLTPGTPVQQEITLLPQQSGVLSLNATVLVDTDSQSISRTYSIPLIAADSHS